MTEHAPELDPTQVRQAVLERRVYKILLVSLAMVVIAFTALWVTYSAGHSGHGGQTSAPPEVARTGASTTSAG
jgi:putative copper export protein